MAKSARAPFPRLLIPALLTTLATLACAPSETPPEPADSRVESRGPGIALASLPAPFRVAANEGDRLVLEAPGESGTATLVVSAGPVETGSINLVEEVKARRALFEQMPGGTYLGNRELRAPIGPAYSARGTFLDDSGALVEETWIYTIHPDEYRLLTLTYSYPAGGDSQTRVQELLTVLGEVEGLGAPAQAGSESPEPPATAEPPADS
jgi:hypothetical protein